MTGEHQSINNRIGFEKEAIPCLDRLYNFAFCITGREKTAFNLLEETYIKALRFYNHLDKSIDFESWMFRIMRNTYMESFSKKLIPDKIDYEKIQIQMAQLSSEDLNQLKKDILDKLTTEEISLSLSTIPDEFKMVIVLSSIVGLKYEDIAYFSDVPTGVVRMRLYRGRKILLIKLYNFASARGYIKKLNNESPETEIKENRDYNYIAALADEELNNSPEQEKIREAIAKEPGLQIEYNFQLLVKYLVTKKLKNITPSSKIKKKLEKKIGSVSKSIRKKSG